MFQAEANGWIYSVHVKSWKKDALSSDLVCQGQFFVTTLILVFEFENWLSKLFEQIRSSFSGQMGENGELENKSRLWLWRIARLHLAVIGIQMPHIICIEFHSSHFMHFKLNIVSYALYLI